MNNYEYANRSLMVDLQGFTISNIEKNLLLHPLVGGVILFGKNFQNKTQLQELICNIREIENLRSDKSKLLIAVDQEGGRVQRFKPSADFPNDKSFTKLPPMKQLGDIFLQQSPDLAKKLTQIVGEILAYELRRCDIDLTFAPVLDLNYGNSSVIGDRSFAENPEIVAELAKILIDAFNVYDLSHCGKHFPGHGFVIPDSHLDLPVDERILQKIIDNDLQPYEKLFSQKILQNVMAAHIIFTEFDKHLTAVFSPKWIDFLHKIYKDKTNDIFVFTDDLSMQGAAKFGDITKRLDLAWNAGCDMLLICNNLPDSLTAINQWKPPAREHSEAKRLYLLDKMTAKNGENANNANKIKDLENRYLSNLEVFNNYFNK